MNTIPFIESERKSLEKIKRMQLPHRFKIVGLAVILISGAAILINIWSVDNLEIKQVAKYGILVGLLFISMSKEKIEDELVRLLRMQSYTFAFIAGVVYTLLSNPIVNYIANLISEDRQAVFEGVGDWQILWMLLSVQLFYFEFLKRMSK